MYYEYYFNKNKIELKQKKVILYKNIIHSPKDIINKNYSLFSLKSIDILLFFQDKFVIYDFKDNKFISKVFDCPLEEKEKPLNHNKYILKIIEYNENEIFILIRDITHSYNDYNDSYEYKATFKYSIILYDMKYNIFKKKYISTEYSGIYNSYMESYYDFDDSFSNYQNIFKISNSIVYIKDNINRNFINFILYVLNILNGDIKYKYDSNDFLNKSKEYNYYCNIWNNSLYLCDNIFLFNGYEIRIKKNDLEENKIDAVYNEFNP